MSVQTSMGQRNSLLATPSQVCVGFKRCTAKCRLAMGADCTKQHGDYAPVQWKIQEALFDANEAGDDSDHWEVSLYSADVVSL